MIVDSSALVAIIRRESDRDRYAEALQKATRKTISAASYLETAIVVDRVHDPVLSRQLDELLATADVEIAPVTPNQARLARAAYRDFGKNSGHPARLNFGDCFSYALAKDKGESLLFKGNDFAHTAIRNALQHPDE